MFNPYFLTLNKLAHITIVLQDAIKTNDFTKVEDEIALLRDYKSCYFCVGFRKNLESRNKGVCDECPCHKKGEGIVGRKISYNGCYSMPPYREMVRLSWWMKQDKSVSSAKALIQAISDTVDFMNINRHLVDIELAR